MRPCFLTVASLVLVVGGALVIAGPLDPPAGPVTSSYKTLSEVEPRTPIATTPYTLTQPGSYYLTRNLTATNGLNGINVNADNVTIDLNGFTLDGNANTGFRGVACASRSNITIRGGRISNWSHEGIDGYQSHQVRVENVQVDNSVAGWGIILGFGSTVSHAQVRRSAAGIIVADGSVVTGCAAEANQRGFEVGPGSTISDCAAIASTGNGYDIGAGVVVHHCTARGNGGNGFQAAVASTLSDCVAQGNAGAGFQIDGAGQLLDSTSTGNGGIGVDILPPGGGTALIGRVHGCTINFNASHGLNQAAGGGSTFSNNLIARNGGAGIRVADGNMIVENRILDNGTPNVAAGLQVNGWVNTIRGNNLLNNGIMYSFASGSGGNLFYGNTCSGGAQLNSGTNTIAPFVNAATAFAGGSMADSNGFVNLQY